MVLNDNQKKAVSGIMADLGKLIFISFVIGKFVSEVKMPNWLFVTSIIATFILLIYAVVILKKIN